METHSPALHPSLQEGRVAALLPSPASPNGVWLHSFPGAAACSSISALSFLQRSALLLCVTAGRILLQSCSCAHLLAAPAAGCILWWIPLCIHPSSPALFPCARSFICACRTPAKGLLASVCLPLSVCAAVSRQPSQAKGYRNSVILCFSGQWICMSVLCCSHRITEL